MVVSIRPTHPNGQAVVMWEILKALPSFPHPPPLSQCPEYHDYILHKYVPLVFFS